MSPAVDGVPEPPLGELISPAGFGRATARRLAAALGGVPVVIGLLAGVLWCVVWLIERYIEPVPDQFFALFVLLLLLLAGLGVGLYHLFGAAFLAWQGVVVARAKRRANARRGATYPGSPEIAFLVADAESRHGLHLEDGLGGSSALAARAARPASAGEARRVVVDLVAFALLSGPLRRSLLRACARLDHAATSADVYRALAAPALFAWLVDRREPSAESLCRSIRRDLMAGEAVVFCGAGISIPSGLPGAVELTSYLLERLGATAEEVEAVGCAAMPFEVVMETLETYSDLTPLLGIFAGGTPNTNHLALARLVRTGRLATIATTNFDQLIEAGLEAAGLQQGTGYHKVYREDDLAGGGWPRRLPLLLKLHGSVEAPKQMAITLRRVARAAASRRLAIRRCFGRGPHRSVVVLGYSASDVFDLSPEIEAVRLGRRRVYFVEHSRLVGVEKNSVQPAKYPFRRYRRGYRLYFPTGELIAGLWKELPGPGPGPAEPDVAPPPWRDRVDAWRAALDAGGAAAAPEMIVGALLEHSAQLRGARTRFSRGLEVARRAADSFLELKALVALARVCSQEGGDAAETKRLAQSALDLSRRLDDRSREAQSLRLLHLAVVKDAEELADRIPMSEEALAIARTSGDAGEESAALLDLASVRLARGEAAEATAGFERALACARQAGAKDVEAHSLGGLGLCAARLRRHKLADRHFSAAIAVCNNLGLPAAESFWLRLRGDVAASWRELPKAWQPAGFREEALGHYDRALEKARYFGGREATAEALLARALLVAELPYGSSLREAEQQLGEALELARETGSSKLEARCRVKLARLHIENPPWRCPEPLEMDREDAIDHAERARALAATGGHRMVELDALCRLGELRLGAAGVQAYLEALVIADRLGEPKNVAHLCLNLADCYVEVEFPAQALPYYERALDLFEEERRALHEDRQGILGANAALRALRNLYHVMVKTTAAKVENHIVIALVEGKRGIALAKLGRYAEAVTLLKKAERTLDKSLAKPDWFRDPRTSLGFGYALAEAEAALRAERKGGSDP